MKTTARFLALPLLLAGMIACSDDENTGPNENSSVAASIDGTAWTAATVQSTYAGNVLAVGGLDAGQTQVLITIPSVTTTGTFDIGAGQPGVAVVTANGQTWSSTLVGGTGSVTVTTLTATHAAGTFTFVATALTTSGATGNKTVTTGSFDVTF